MRSLKDGSQMSDTEVERILASFRALRTEDPIIFYEFATKARKEEEDFMFPRDAGGFGRLLAYDLVTADGVIQPKARSVAKSAIEGPDDRMVIGSPYR